MFTDSNAPPPDRVARQVPASGESGPASFMRPRADALASFAGARLTLATEPRTHRILIADDEEELRAVCALLLSSESVQCEDVPDGAAALEALRARPFDLVLIDCEMPLVDGMEIACRLRQEPPVPNLKVILMSGHIPSDEMAALMLNGVDDFLSKPFSAVQLQARVKAALRLKDAQDHSARLVGELLRFNSELERTVSDRERDLIGARDAMVLALAKLAEYRDNDTGAHLLRMERYCRVLAAAAARLSVYSAQLTEDFMDMLCRCAPLHDIGKVGIPDNILLKAGKLDPDEWVIMRTHTTIGAQTLEAVARQHGFALPMLRMAIDIARHHHERFDGTGYPDQLFGGDIPLAARLVAIADVYDALRSRRPYKPALPHVQSVEEMMPTFGGHFDPALLPAFRRSAAQFELIYAGCQEVS